VLVVEQELALVAALELVVAWAHLAWEMAPVLALVWAPVWQGNRQSRCNSCPNLCCNDHHWHHLGNHHMSMHHPMHSNNIRSPKLNQPIQPTAKDVAWQQTVHNPM
jgi:hypothetical protein